tara:strand:+ start:1238 stop:1660 length:423 start_codon:yes stop_codon:yes gene_type:complete
MNMPVLLVQLAGQRIALPALEVDSVIELGKITPVPGAPSHILGISSLRSRALTVIDCSKVLEVNDYDNNGTKHAAVLNFEGYDYALLVDEVEDVVEALSDPVPVPGGAGEIWSKISDGLIETNAGPAMLIKIDTVINNLH